MVEFVEVPLDVPRSLELEGTDTQFGGDATADPVGIASGGFVGLIGNRPIGFRASRLFETLGTPVPPNLSLFKRFDVFLIPHRLSVIRRRGLAEPTAVGIEIEYEMGQDTCSVVSLFPSYEYVRTGAIGFESKGTLAIGGDVGIPEATAESTTSRSIGALTVRALSAGGDLKTTVGLSLEAVVSTPRIMAVGIGSDRCEWRFDRASEPLFGRDIETWAGVVLGKRTERVRYRARAFMITRIAFVPTRRESKWIEVDCPIEQ